LIDLIRVHGLEFILVMFQNFNCWVIPLVLNWAHLLFALWLMCVMGFDPMCHMCVIIYKDGFSFQSTKCSVVHTKSDQREKDLGSCDKSVRKMLSVSIEIW